MEKYLFTNWETIPRKGKTADWQLDRYLKVCVASIDNPQKVLFVLTLFGKSNGGDFSRLIEIVRNHELGQDVKNEFSFLSEPIDGEFIEVPSKHGPLFRVFTKDDAKYGMCHPDSIGKVERTSDGKVKIYHSIKVFTLYTKDEDFGKMVIVPGWLPEKWYYRFFGYNYHVLSDLTEPLQL